MVFERGSSTAMMRARTAHFTAQRRKRCQNGRRVMGKIVIHRHAIGFTAQLKTTTGVNE